MSSPVLQLQDVEVRYGRRIVLQDIRLEVEPKRWIALVGPNASGKSTLLRCAAGQLAPAMGSALLLGRALYPLSGDGPLPGFAVPPEVLPPFLSLRQCMDIHAEAHGLPAVPAGNARLADTLGLAEHLDTFAGNCSLGTRQKLSIVLALMTDPPLLLLDEVFNGLDAASALQLKGHLRERVQDGMSILMATHALDLVARCCNGMVLLESGRIRMQWDVQALRGLGDAEGIEQALAAATSGSRLRP